MTGIRFGLTVAAVTLLGAVAGYGAALWAILALVAGAVVAGAVEAFKKHYKEED